MDATPEEIVVDDWCHYLSSLRTVALRKGLRADKLTLDVLLAGGEAPNIESGIADALAKSMLAETEAEIEKQQRGAGAEDDVVPVIRMDFTGGTHG